MDFDDINSDEWEEELGKAIDENLDLTSLDELEQNLLDYAQTALDVVETVVKVANGSN